MDDARRTGLRRAYLNLGSGELSAAATFGAVAVGIAMPRLEARNERLALWCALAPLLVVLLHAGAYWLCARSWAGRAPMPAVVAAIYRGFRWLDAALLFVGLVGLVRWWPQHLGVGCALGFVWLFGVVEYLNYFVVRLSYPLRTWPTKVRRWRTPRLVKDLNQSRHRQDR